MVKVLPDEHDGDSEMLMINPRQDILKYEVPLGASGVEKAKQIAAESLARMIVKHIEPEFIEMKGFEIMRYTLVVKKYE